MRFAAHMLLDLLVWLGWELMVRLLLTVMEHRDFAGRPWRGPLLLLAVWTGCRGATPTRTVMILGVGARVRTMSDMLWTRDRSHILLLDRRLSKLILAVYNFAHDATRLEILGQVEFFEDFLQFALRDQIGQLEVVFGASFQLHRRIPRLLLQIGGPHSAHLLFLTTTHLGFGQSHSHGYVQSCRCLQRWRILIHFGVQKSKFE